MKLENRCLIPASRETTWSLLMDIPRSVALVPGIEQVTPDGDDRYQVTMKVSVGPMRINFSGTIQVLEKDPGKGEAKFQVEAADRRVGGSLRSEMVVRLSTQPDGQTELVIETDVAFMGKLGELGQPIIRRKAATALNDFARNLSDEVRSSAG